ncbi:MAG: YicC family protein [Spirochaetales bacterium]|nr:YicC family protein [Spirochaetales bacterium]
MTSMTGFAFAEVHENDVSLVVELKSYNNRYFDLSLTLPSLLSRWEPELRERLASRISRGKIELTVRLKERSSGTPYRLDLEAAQNWKSALMELRQRLGLSGKLRLEDLSGRPGVFTEEEKHRPEEVWELLVRELPKVLNDFEKSRLTEGERLAQDLLIQLGILESSRLFLLQRSADMEGIFRENLQRKFAELAAEVDENRVATEIAVLLMKTGVNEELVRLASHLESFHQIMDEPGAVGKKLDFLCQEIGREINTVGSKTTLSDVQQRVVVMKDALENLREQLRNVE